ncbi:unnamed protein product, partial [marine sediment metagenome]
SLNCALWGKAYNIALRRKVELKDHEDNAEEIQPTDKTQASNEKPAIDDTLGVDQFPQQSMEKILHNSDIETLIVFSDMIYAEIKSRPSPEDPATT